MEYDRARCSHAQAEGAPEAPRRIAERYAIQIHAEETGHQRWWKEGRGQGRQNI